jgi:hypothetical protein
VLGIHGVSSESRNGGRPGIRFLFVARPSKTYPSPSVRYVETSCVAGMAEDGRLVRLFPVPFRLVEDDQQFKKWQWVRARVRRAQDDARPESHRISVDTIELEGEPLSTRDCS